MLVVFVNIVAIFALYVRRYDKPRARRNREPFGTVVIYVYIHQLHREVGVRVVRNVFQGTSQKHDSKRNKTDSV